MKQCLLLSVVVALLLPHGARLKFNKVVGGFSCPIEDHSYLVSLSNRNWDAKKMSFKLDVMCGGSLLSSMWVLTAAHCFISLGDHAYATVGQDCQHDDSSPGAQTSEIDEFIKNPNFTLSGMTGDVALAKLKTPIKESRYVSYVRLSKHMEDSWLWQNCNDSIAAGWGVIYAMDYRNRPLGTVKKNKGSCLHCVELAVIPTEQCMRMHLRSSGDVVGKTPFRDGGNNVICAWSEGRDTCVGDSGGPLMCRGLQIGIISLGVGCAYGSAPPVYTRVDYYYGYIQQVIYLHS